MTATEDVALVALVTLVGRHIPYSAVAMFAVVPVSEASDPALRRGDVGKRRMLIGGSVL